MKILLHCLLAAALNLNKRAAEHSTLPCKCETETQKPHKAVKYYLYTQTQSDVAAVFFFFFFSKKEAEGILGTKTRLTNSNFLQRHW